MLIIGVLTLSSAFNGADQFLALAAILALLWYGMVLFRRLQRGEAGVETIEELSEHPR